MNFTTTGSRFPARAVCYHAQSMGPDGDGGETAGTPLAGEGAASSLRFNSRGQSCEIPLHDTSTGGCHEPMVSRSNSPFSRSSPAASLSSDPGSVMGCTSLTSEAVDATLPPRIKLKPRSFNIGTWNMNGLTGRTGTTSYHKVPHLADLFSITNLDLLLVTETHCSNDPFPDSSKFSILANSTRVADHSRPSAGVALLARKDGSWTCEEFIDIIPGYAILVSIRHSHSAEIFWILGIYGDTSCPYTSLEDMYSTIDRKSVV